ncbi:MAG: DUF4340 domain-containing protein [Clostridia bacterium]|nr:DUF4340 domain-containing protein [Clostridia bacterium]
MLKVEKKQKKGSGKKVIFGGLFLLLLGSGILAYIALQPPEPFPVRIDTRGSLWQRDPGEIEWMKIQVKGRNAWIAERNEAGEMVTQVAAVEVENTEDWALDEVLGDQMLDALANMVYEEILTEDAADYQERLAEFGLSEPALIAEVRYTDGTEKTIRVGDKSEIDDQDLRFMLIDGDDRLFAVAGSLMEDLTIEQAVLHPVVQPEIQTSRLDRITVWDKDGKKINEWTLDGQITDADAAGNWLAGWEEEKTWITYPADQDQMSNLKKNAGNLRLGLYVAEGTEENLVQYGLSQPQYRIEIHLAAGTTGQILEEGAYDVKDWEEECLTFAIGQSRNEMTDYALYQGTIYTMNHFTTATLTETRSKDTTARYPVLVALENLSGMEIYQPDGTITSYELQRSTVPAEVEGEVDQVVISCRKDGEEIPYSVFEAAYERWLVINVSGTLPAGWQKKSTEISYAFRTLAGKTHTVEMSDFDGLHDAVTVDGRTLYYLIKNSFSEMP